MKQHNFLLGAVFFLLFTAMQKEDILYFTEDARVSFTSDAPMELIKARSDGLAGILNLDDGSFAFAINVESFEGFNSNLQRVHFNENYMETDKYPKAKFNGRIKEDVDLKRDGEYRVTASGQLLIHGIKEKRDIPVQLTKSGQSIRFEAEFDILLAEHEIKIPSVVNKKIAEVVYVQISGELKPME